MTSLHAIYGLTPQSKILATRMGYIPDVILALSGLHSGLQSLRCHSGAASLILTMRTLFDLFLFISGVNKPT